jgi:hypothetical protein
MSRSRSLAELVEQNRSSQPTSLATAATAVGTSESKPGGSDPGRPDAGSGPAAQAVKAEIASSLLAAFCWVAAEYYPRGSFNWYCCRSWVLQYPRLTKVYAKHGETFARFLRTHPVCRWLFTPVVRYACRRGEM